MYIKGDKKSQRTTKETKYRENIKSVQKNTMHQLQQRMRRRIVEMHGEAFDSIP
jgi:hypothetical protein